MAFEQLRRIERNIWKEALVETLICNGFALLPIALGTIWSYVAAQKSPPPFADLLCVSVQQGELFVMSASAIGATLYVIGKERSFRFPYLLFFVSSLLVLFGAGILFFSLNKATNIALPSYAIKASVYVYMYTCVLGLLASAIHQSIPDVNGPMHDAEKDFTADFWEEASSAMTTREFNFPCIRVQQPIGEFFIASIDCRELRDITYNDIRRIEDKESRDVEKYLGIQRLLNLKRAEDIQRYVQTADATFPTSVIVAVDEKCATYDADKRILTLRPFGDPTSHDSITTDKIAKILDGQHRLKGLDHWTGAGFELNVCIFIGADMATQANVFSTVNLAQTKVNKSLVYDLFELAKSRSPYKTCHLIAVALNSNEGSPLFHRIKRLGVATPGRVNETITQATLAESLMPYISSDPLLDRDTYFRGDEPSKASTPELSDCIFRQFFLSDKDLLIADILYNYFSAVRGRWTPAWDNFGQGNMLNKTNGFRALMRLLRPMYLYLTSPAEMKVPDASAFLELFQKSRLESADFNIDRFKPGTSGESAMFHHLRQELNLTSVR